VQVGGRGVPQIVDAVAGVDKPGNLLVSRFTAADFVDQVIRLGWTDRATVERFPAAIRSWNDHPDSLWATMFFETVAWVE
jgi:hypothetical protein